MSNRTASPSMTRRWQLTAVAQLAALVVFIVFSIAFIKAIWGLGPSSRNYPTVVLTVGIVVALFGAFVVVRGALRDRSGGAPTVDEGEGILPRPRDAGEGADATPRHPNLIVIASIVLMIALVEATQIWGLLASVVVYAPLQMLVVGDRTWWRLLGVAVATPVVLYLLLYRVLLIPLP